MSRGGGGGEFHKSLSLGWEIWYRKGGMEDLKKLPQNNVYDSILLIMVEIELSLK